MSLYEELALVHRRAGWPWDKAWELAEIDLRPWQPEEDELDLGQLGGPQDCKHSACTCVPMQ